MPDPRRIILGPTVTCCALLIGACQATGSRKEASDARPQDATAVQALIGAAEYHKLEFERAETGNPGNTVTADLSTMPAIGIAGLYALAGEEVEFGLDGGVLVSWESDRAADFAPGTGNAVVLVDRTFVVTDLFLGGYASATLGDRVRAYGAAGPNLVIGHADYRDEVISESDTGVGFGGYVRGGLELRLRDRSFLGVGVRWVGNEVDFDDPIGDIDFEGWQLFLTFTVGM